MLILCFTACDGAPSDVGAIRQELELAPGVVDLMALDSLNTSVPEVFLNAPWGADHGGLSREEEAAQTGPMAIAAEPDGGLAILDTVGGRVLRYDGQGMLQSAIPIGVETGDALIVLPDASFAVLAYRHDPRPGHDILTFSSDGAALRRRPTPMAATMPTALLFDLSDETGSRLLVENRHRAVHPVDGSPRLWGRPVGGERLIRVRLLSDGLVTLTVRDRSGQLAWERDLAVPWRVTEVLDLAACDEYVALFLRGIVGSHHQTYAIAFDHSGQPLGTLALLDRRVTDAARPFALSPSGDIFELETTEEGVTVHRYRREGGVR